MIFARDIDQFLFNDGIQFFDDQDLVQTLQETDSQLLGEGVGRRHFQDPGRVGNSTEVIQGQRQTDAARRDALLHGLVFLRINAFFHDHSVPAVFGKYSGQFDISGFDLLVIGVGQTGEDDPAGGVFFKSVRLVMKVFVLIFDLDRRIGVTDPGRGTEKNGRAVLFGKFKSLLDHFISFLHRGRIEAGKLTEI